ncbi:hypothetical protein [Chitinophaga parva]|nr:hypothetical protein [Chitinophaga parva]
MKNLRAFQLAGIFFMDIPGGLETIAGADHAPFLKSIAGRYCRF